MDQSCWKLEVVAGPRAADAIADAIADHVDAVTLFPAAGDADGDAAPVRLIAFAATEPDEAALAAAIHSIEADLPYDLIWLPSRDWLADNRASFEPIAVGRFFIHPTHYDGPIPAGACALAIDAAAAFGTGSHGSTQGCLAALDHLARRDSFRDRWPMLDVGCGTAVLGLAAARVARRNVIASDIDHHAVAVAVANARQNNLAPLLTAVTAPGLRHPVIKRHAPYGLIIANILARPLVSLAPSIAAHLRRGGPGGPGGTVILAGLLATQERLVRHAYAAQGLYLQHRIDVDEWRTLVLAR